MAAVDPNTMIEVIIMRFQAAVDNFTAALIMEDAKEQEKLRMKLHTLLDAHLDAVAAKAYKILQGNKK